VVFDTNQIDQVKVLKRILTKVPELPETYKVRIIKPSPSKLNVTVEPEELKFLEINEKLTDPVHFTSKVASNSEAEHGYTIWESREH